MADMFFLGESHTHGKNVTVTHVGADADTHLDSKDQDFDTFTNFDVDRGTLIFNFKGFKVCTAFFYESRKCCKL